MSRGRASMGLMLLLCALPAAANGQQRPGHSERARMEAEVRERFEAMVQKELGLDEATARTLSDRARAFQPERRALAQRRRQLQRRMSGTGALLSEEEAREVLDDMTELARQEAELLAREQADLLEVLSPGQLVRLYGLREQLGHRIRE
ncbi:MAG: hypothetical protein P8188_14390, partial [Gemmatimonadota bacterium]